MTVGLAMALTANLVDLIPNSGLSPVTWLLAGALCGRLEHQKVSGAARPEEIADPGPPGRRAAVLARDGLTTTYSKHQETPARATREALPYRRSFKKVERT